MAYNAKQQDGVTFVPSVIKKKKHGHQKPFQRTQSPTILDSNKPARFKLLRIIVQVFYRLHFPLILLQTAAHAK